MRTTTYIRVAICITVLFVLVARPSSVSACSCILSDSVADEFARSDAVFTGKVVRVADNYFPYFFTIDFMLYKLKFKRSLLGNFSRENYRLYSFDVFFKVLNSWKGVNNTFVEVNTGRGGGDCGYTFETGKEYLIYASPAYGIPDNYWVTGICSRNALLPDATEDLKYLNSLPELPLKFTVPIPWAQKDTITLVLAMMVVGVIVFTKRRRRIRQ